MKNKFTLVLLLASAYTFAQDNSTVSKTNAEVPKTTAAATKRVLIEEATGTWCGWCVRGIVMMGELDSLYPATTALVAVHNGDPMVNSTYDSGLGSKISGYPSGVVDRQGSGDPQDFKKKYLARVTYAPAIDVFIDNLSWNASTRALSFKVNATTVAAFNGSYRFNASITEMKVHGTASGYAQHNYYAGGGSGAMGGFESKPGTIPAAQMYFDFVGRAILGGWAGTAGSIPATNAAGVTVSYTYTTTIPATWNENNLSIIGFVINSTNGSVENASKTKIISSTEIGENFKTEFVAYPNPTQGLVNIRNSGPLDITAYNMMGEAVKSEKNVSQIDLSALNGGVYFLKFDNGKEVLTKKFVLLK